MDLIISSEELTRLKNSDNKLHSLEIDGVDNWEWYGQTPFKEDLEEDIKKEYKASKSIGYGFTPKYEEKEDLYYINQECKLEGYVNKETCVISIEPEIDEGIVSDELSGTCTSCMVGGGPNMPAMSCTCSDTLEAAEYVVSVINDMQERVFIICKESQLHKKPYSKVKNEQEEEEHNKRKSIILEKVKELKILEIELNSSKRSLENEIKTLEEKKESMNKIDEELKSFE